jgi:hypothetical protein
MKKGLLLLGNMIFIFFSCNKDDHKVIPIPPPFKASFQIYEAFYGSNRIFPTDTIVNFIAMFKGGDNYDSYSWVVGTDPTVHVTQSFKLTFSLNEVGQTLPVTLIASKDGQSDTVQKQFTVMAVKGTPNERATPFCVQLNYMGNFKGSFEDEPNHQFTISIVNFDDSLYENNAMYFQGFRIVNLPEGCGGTYVAGQPCIVTEVSPFKYSYGFQYTYKAFLVSAGDEIGCCPPVVLYGYMDSVDSRKLIIEYNLLNSDGQPHVDTLVRRKFIGYRQ